MAFSNLMKLNGYVFACSAVGLSLGGIIHYFGFDPMRFHETSDALWSEKWRQVRQSYTTPPWQQRTPNTAVQFLKASYSKIPKITNFNQIRTIRVLVPLCGASPDLEAINEYMHELLIAEVPDADERLHNYKIKIIGVEISADAIEMCLDRMDRHKKGISETDFDAQEYYANGSAARTSGHYGYHVTMDRFSKLNVYRESNFHLIHSSIFHQSMQRLILRADLIFDAQALDVIEERQQRNYAGLMKTIMSKNGAMLIQVNRYNINARHHTQRESAPYSMSKADLFRMYRDMVGDNETRIQLLHSENWLDSANPQKIQRLGFPEGYDGGFNDIYLIQGNDAVLRDAI